MSDDTNDHTTDKAAEARAGLIGSVTGRVKEVAGALTGNDDLVEEGQLRQAEARSRKEAVGQDAIAEAERDEAAQELQESNREADAEKYAATVQAQRENAETERQQSAESAAADAAAVQEEAAGRAQAEQQADDLAESRLREAETLEDAADDTELAGDTEEVRLRAEADRAEQQAAGLRADAATTETTQS